MAGSTISPNRAISVDYVDKLAAAKKPFSPPSGDVPVSSCLHLTSDVDHGDRIPERKRRIAD
jgi:hypothetical protein